MVDTPAPEQWAQLRMMRPQAEYALATMPIAVDGEQTALSIGMDQAGHLHLLIPVDGDSVQSPPPDLNGLRVRYWNLDTGQVLDLCAPSSHEQVFTAFCREIVDAIVIHSRDPSKAVAATIRTWQSAWRPARQQMDKTTQVGLFGELLVLRTLMIPSLGSVAVSQWSGPQSERHDFVGERLHVEVKTTRKSRSEHEISRLDQLRVPLGRELLLVSVQLEETIGGDQNLATQVDAVVDLLRGDPAALDEFMAKLVNIGWSDDMRNSGELLRFFVRSAEVYAVDENFPRLADDFVPPRGVVSVKYTVDLAALPALGVDEAGGILKHANR